MMNLNQKQIKVKTQKQILLKNKNVIFINIRLIEISILPKSDTHLEKHVDEYREIYAEYLVDTYLSKCNADINLVQMGLQLEKSRKLAELFIYIILKVNFLR